MIVDTKFTAGSLVQNQWGKPVYESSHLYQLYAYLRSQEQVSAGYRSVEGVLLYPAVKTRLSERVALQGHVMRIDCVDLAAEWEEAERQSSMLVAGRNAKHSQVVSRMCVLNSFVRHYEPCRAKK